EDPEKDHKIVGTCTLFIEYKFIRSLALRGRIEDLVVDYEYRRKGIARSLLEMAVGLAKRSKCYKLTLECLGHLQELYGSFGFRAEPNQKHLVLRF
ncbi:hypothetical protein ACOME3_003169, partial [Neoechinorhynchus agilis]